MNKCPDGQCLFAAGSDASADELRAVTENLRRLIDLNAGGITVFDDDEVFCFANPHAGELAGRPSESIVGIRLSDLFRDENLAIIRDLKEVHLRGLETIRPTIELQTAKGDKRDVQVAVIPMGGRLAGLNFLHLRDRTERVATEAALRNMNAFFIKLIDSAADGIVAADMAGRIIVFSRGAERLLGYTRAEALRSVHVRQLYPRGEAQRIMKMMRSDDYGGRGMCQRQRITGVTKEGREVPIALSGSIVYDEDGGEVATLGIFTDLSELEALGHEIKLQQEALIQSEKLASIGKLASGVAHEINNPLTGILTYIEDLIEEADLDDPRRDDYEVIYRETMRCREIVRNLLDFGRQQRPVMTPNPFNEIIMRAIRLVSRLPRFRNASLSADLAPGMAPVVCNATEIQQVLVNLLVNAAEAMPDGGHVQIVSRALPDDAGVEVRVSDTGHGMDEETRKQIFEPFFSTKGGKTNGLGLAVSWGIIERHGGAIQVESEVGAGTTFIITLPLKPAQTENSAG